MLVELHFHSHFELLVAFAFAPQTLTLQSPQHPIPSHSLSPPCPRLFNRCTMRIPKRHLTFSLSNFSPQLAPLLSPRLRFASLICAKRPHSVANASSPGPLLPYPLFLFFFLLNTISCALSFFNSTTLGYNCFSIVP